MGVYGRRRDTAGGQDFSSGRLIEGRESGWKSRFFSSLHEKKRGHLKVLSRGGEEGRRERSRRDCAESKRRRCTLRGAKIEIGKKERGEEGSGKNNNNLPPSKAI